MNVLEVSTPSQEPTSTKLPGDDNKDNLQKAPSTNENTRLEKVSALEAQFGETKPKQKSKTYLKSSPAVGEETHSWASGKEASLARWGKGG